MRQVEIFFKQNKPRFNGKQRAPAKGFFCEVNQIKKEMITMKNRKFTKSLSLILSVVLVAAMALFAVGCNGNQNEDLDNQGTTNLIENGSVVGQGEKSFTFTVVDGEGNEVSCEIKTDKTVVGDALLELGLIAGEPGAYGLYVKTVNGITADYDVDGSYWAFYIDGEYAMSGVDTTDITDGAVYMLKVEK